MLSAAIAGVQHGDYAKAPGLATGDELILEWEPGNQYDPFAIKVLLARDPSIKLGYVPAKLTQSIHLHRRQGHPLHAKLTVNEFATKLHMMFYVTITTNG